MGVRPEGRVATLPGKRAKHQGGLTEEVAPKEMEDELARRLSKGSGLRKREQCIWSSEEEVWETSGQRGCPWYFWKVVEARP